MDKIGNYYSYIDGMLRFTYYPKDGMVKGANQLSTLMAIEHFSRRGFEIDWTNIRNNPTRLILMIKLPDHMNEEEALNLIGKTKDELCDQEREDKERARESVISNNIDEHTNKTLKWGNVERQLNLAKDKGRDAICEYVNSFNIEDIRPDYPYMIKSTKNSVTLVKEGKRLLKALFEEGKLKRYDKEKRKQKMQTYESDK